MDTKITTNTEGYDDGNAPITFHYNRERRLASAPKNVREYYNGNYTLKRGLLRVLVATPRLRMLFISMAALCVFVWVITMFGGNDAKKTLAGIPVTLSAFSFDGTVFITVAFAAQKDWHNDFVNADVFGSTGDAVLQPIGKIAGIYDGTPYFLRTKATDFDILHIEAAVTVESADANPQKPAATTILRSTVEKR